MRFFQTFPIALNEIKRELKEMGIEITTKSVQNQEGPIKASKEITNYQYLVTQPNWREIPTKDPEWCEAEFNERISGFPYNPGKAWQLRHEYWGQFRDERTGKFDYSYPERITGNLEAIIETLKKDLYTRRAFLPIFDRDEDPQEDFTCRIPCSLGYWFNYRGDMLNITYFLRSSDFFEHLPNDILLADRLKCHVAEQLGVKPGQFCHWIGSLHCFERNVKDVF